MTCLVLTCQGLGNKAALSCSVLDMGNLLSTKPLQILIPEVTFTKRIKPQRKRNVLFDSINNKVDLAQVQAKKPKDSPFPKRKVEIFNPAREAVVIF